VQNPTPLRPRLFAKTATTLPIPSEAKAFCDASEGAVFASGVDMVRDKRFVYVLKSTAMGTHFYVGLTSNVAARVCDHNDGRCPHTAMRRPWKLHVSIEFVDESTAIRFERYLKSGSGRAFARRHFEP
jgi:predicted GIY-YIG superfamily endonuclease